MSLTTVTQSSTKPLFHGDNCLEPHFGVCERSTQKSILTTDDTPSDACEDKSEYVQFFLINVSRFYAISSLLPRQNSLTNFGLCGMESRKVVVVVNLKALAPDSKDPHHLLLNSGIHQAAS